MVVVIGAWRRPILSIDGHPVPQDEDMTHRLRTWAGFEN
ncbi:aminodeoxychorismate lyase [Cutibacterium acnes JCM 18916]|nr:aminodeoxychorismate lyase [Cutibacterium acnes JCM 18916]